MISSQELTQTKGQSIVDQMSGKVSGVAITGSGSPGGSSMITIRGSNSITGDNTPNISGDNSPVERRCAFVQAVHVGALVDERGDRLSLLFGDCCGERRLLRLCLRGGDEQGKRKRRNGMLHSAILAYDMRHDSHRLGRHGNTRAASR